MLVLHHLLAPAQVQRALGQQVLGDVGSVLQGTQRVNVGVEAVLQFGADGEVVPQTVIVHFIQI